MNVLALQVALYPPPLPLERSAYYYDIITYMSCNCVPQIEKYGAEPANIQWSVVRGDTSTLRVEFWEADEVTEYDTASWTYIATAYNPVTDTYYDLTTEIDGSAVDIIATPTQTELWGTANRTVVAELTFDLEVTIPGDPDTTWTPVIGTICVLGDSSRGSLS